MKFHSRFTIHDSRLKNALCIVHRASCIFFLYCALCTVHCSAEYIRVGVFSNLKSSQYVFTPVNSDYLFTGDHKHKLIVRKDESVTFQLNGKTIIAKYKEKTVGKFL